MAAKTTHVFPENSRWAVVREGSDNPKSVHATQREAIDAAKRLTRKLTSCQIVVHDRNGRVRVEEVRGLPVVQSGPYKSKLGRAVIERAGTRPAEDLGSTTVKRIRPRDVFINCPFDESYKPVFDGIIFTILDLGFVPRCALEVDDGAEVRLHKIARIIEECRYGIHDISAAGLSKSTGLPRFNMPLELGLFLGCRLYGQDQHRKHCLILDSEPYRYRASISDIAGQDIHAHSGDPSRAILEVRNWLASTSRIKGLPGGSAVNERYRRFRAELPFLCDSMRRDPVDLPFADYSEMIEIWLATSR